ncbi:MAG: OmpH family outer membrane protein [Bacteroidales bacterium]|jgi:outer membrane protein|nr:OmpH family outer membrane protein [Bacteroidales bacterium]
MKKIMTFAVCAMLAMTASAQKFGNINMGEVFETMPERAVVQKEMEELQAKYETELSKMGDEYQKKVNDYLAEQEKLEKSIADARAQEIEQLQQRIQNFREMAAKDLQTQQQNKVQPIIEKINKAIQTVGEKEGFTYIFDLSQGNILYASPSQCIDVLPLVKKELGLQ